MSFLTIEQKHIVFELESKGKEKRLVFDLTPEGAKALGEVLYHRGISNFSESSSVGRLTTDYGAATNFDVVEAIQDGFQETRDFCEEPPLTKRIKEVAKKLALEPVKVLAVLREFGHIPKKTTL